MSGILALGAAFAALGGSASADVSVGGASVGLGGIQIQVPGVDVPLPGVDVAVPEVGAQLGASGSNPGDTGQAVPPDTGDNGATSDPPVTQPPTAAPDGGDTPTGSDPGSSPGTGTDTGAGTGGSTNGGASDGGGGGNDSGDAGGGGGQPTEAGGERNGSAAPPAEAAPQNESGGDRGDAKEASTEPTLSTRAGDLIADIPSGILIALALMTILGLLMTGRSAWFARATERLRVQRHALEEDVGALQAALVPALPSRIGDTAVDASYAPAGGPAAGGDFHDVFELGDGRLGMVLGDISGHGREAVPKTGIVRFTLRAYLEAGHEPRTAIRMADLALGSSFEDDFATAVVATWDPATRRLVYSSAGHPKPIVVGAGTASEVDVLGAPPIGIGNVSGSRQTTLALGSDAEVWLFSDGLTEAREPGGRAIGRAELRRRLEKRPEPDELLADLPGREASTRDDMTVVRIKPENRSTDFEPFSVETLLVESTHDGEAVGEFLEACGLTGDDLAQCRGRIATERRHEGKVLVRVSRLGEALHWRVERVDPRLAVPVGLPTAATPIPH